MGFFAGHKLIKEEDAYILVLYVDLMTEFSEPLDRFSKDDEKNLRKHIEQYIRRNVPGVKIKAAHIVAGSLVVATLTLSSVGVTAYAQSAPRAPYIYIVRQGDSLYEIAKQHHTTIYELIRINHLDTDLIYPGQTLRIPLFTLPDGVYGTGDTSQEVGIIQTVLAAFGYRLPVDTIYGSITTEVIENFQKRYPEIRTDGIYGPETKASMEKELYSPFHIVDTPDSRLVLVNKSNSLPYDYIPADLVVPDVPFTIEEFVPQKQMRKEAAGALEALFAKAQQDHIDLFAVSGYRSYERQAEIFARNAQKSENANLLSARPGESEHQTGLAMDVTSPSVGYRLSQSLGDTQEGQWLSENAAEFGFIIRYLKGKEDITGYLYEPWHIRYVGKDTARVIMQKGLTLEEYLQ